MKNTPVPLLPIKKRSLSMPTISPTALPHPIHKIRKSKQGEILIQKEANDQLPVLSLLGMKNKEEEEFSSKIKIIAERNMKKIEGRYETVDRWKHKYIPDSSVLLIKLKEREGELIEDSRQTVEHQSQEIPPAKGHQQKHQKLLPVIARHPFIQTIPDHREQSRKLEEELVTRLQKNKRYYNVKSKVEKEINYFQHLHERSTFDKRREIQLKRILATSERNQKFSGMFHKKISLSEHFPGLKFIKDSLKKREEHHNQKDNPEQQRELTFSRLIKRSKSINEFKESLLEQAAEMVLEGWNNNFHPHESDNDLQQ